MNLSQEELGARCDLGRTYISGIQRGTQTPTVQTLWFIAKGLDVAPRDLIAAIETEMASAALGD